MRLLRRLVVIVVALLENPGKGVRESQRLLKKLYETASADTV